MNQEKAILDVTGELNTARSKFGSFYSPHEGLSIIQEEYEELKAEVYKQFSARTNGAMQKEARHIAAMALRFMIELT